MPPQENHPRSGNEPDSPPPKPVLIDIRDLNDDHEVGGQDLPSLVTVEVGGGSMEAALSCDPYLALQPFNIRSSFAGHVEFCTFSTEAEIRQFFHVPPEKTPAELAAEQYLRRACVQTVGALRAAIADLPDDFPLIHTRAAEEEGLPAQNLQGLKVQTGAWQFTALGAPEQRSQWGLRLEVFDPAEWASISNGTWRNFP